MKKMMIALVAMFVMTMSANAQSNDQSLMFKRLNCYLELTESQIEPVMVSMRQFNSSMEDLSKKGRGMRFMAADKIVECHKKQMKNILSEKQYQKFEEMFNLTISNTIKINMARSPFLHSPS